MTIIESFNGQVVLEFTDQNNTFTALIYNQFAVPQIAVLFLTSWDNLLWDTYNIFQKAVDNFEIQNIKYSDQL